MLTLQTPIKDINKIAAEIAPKFKKLSVENVRDLLFYFPFRYDDYSNLIKINELVLNVLTTIRGKIELLESRRSFKKRMILIEAILSDESGKVKVVWFNQRYLAKVLHIGDEVFLSGKPVGTEKIVEFHNPSFEKINKWDKFTAHTARIVPIYSSTEKLSQRQIRFLVKRILPLSSYVADWLPKEIVKSANLISLAQAIRQVHFPATHKAKDEARFRLKFDEIFLIQARAQIIKQELLKLKAKKVEFKEKETREFVNNLSFTLTKSQKKSAWEIIKDLRNEKPMNRLLEGDVGSGKTISAGIAILNVLLNKYQVAYMAPTEILAHQQFNAFCNIFSGYDFKIGLLTRSEVKIKTQSLVSPQNIVAPTFRSEKINNSELPEKSLHSFGARKLGATNVIDKNTNLKKSDLIKMFATGEIDLIIGTHALIQEKIKFKNLNFVIIDEQHRFGVEQRKQLRKKANGFPHLLSMTATPIPRSLALTLYGDLDLSIISEMPKNRKPIETKVVEPHQRLAAYNFIRKQISAGRQVFVICPLIDPSDQLGFKAVTEEFEKLDKQVFKEIEIGLLHGRLKSKEKEKIMQEFLANKIKVLVSTQVVEVGIDVPNATVMLIESAERFGLSQLHQLRGRVGRSEHKSYCFLFTESDAESVLKRMQAFVQAKNGFELAEKDLEFRGPGEVYGIRQSGFYDSLKIAKLTDWPVIKAVRTEIDKLFAHDSSLNMYPKIKERIKEFETSVHFE